MKAAITFFYILLTSSLFAQHQSTNNRNAKSILSNSSIDELYKELHLREAFDTTKNIIDTVPPNLPVRNKLARISNARIFNEINKKQELMLKELYGDKYDREYTIWGMDNRRDLYEIVNFEISKNARATCCLVDNSDIEVYDNFNYKINCRSTGYCSDVRFHDQKRLARCSAFAIAPEIILTAGHCITEETISSCSILYEFNIPEKSGRINSIVKSDNVYKIIKLLERGKLSNGLDYAILNIDRPVSNDRILQIRRTGKLHDNSKLYVAGYPDGLPLKISNDGNIRNNDYDITFSTDLDTFQGNSGSPVFNEITHVVEGILTAGDIDFFFDDNDRCQRLFKCSEITCRGEIVVRITELLPYIQKYLNN